MAITKTFATVLILSGIAGFSYIVYLLRLRWLRTKQKWKEEGQGVSQPNSAPAALEEVVVDGDRKEARQAAEEKGSEHDGTASSDGDACKELGEAVVNEKPSKKDQAAEPTADAKQKERVPPAETPLGEKQKDEAQTAEVVLNEKQWQESPKRRSKAGRERTVNSYDSIHAWLESVAVEEGEEGWNEDEREARRRRRRRGAVRTEEKEGEGQEAAVVGREEKREETVQSEPCNGGEETVQRGQSEGRGKSGDKCVEEGKEQKKVSDECTPEAAQENCVGPAGTDKVQHQPGKQNLADSSERDIEARS